MMLHLRYLLMVHLCCPIGLHWRRPVAIQRQVGILPPAGRCIFCGDAR